MGLAGQLEYSLALLSRDGRSVTAQRPGTAGEEAGLSRRGGGIRPHR